ncbi:MAG: DNA ligase [Planctomycetes bacterium]|nr:DNA ligase [Planctomycetota bacterium]
MRAKKHLPAFIPPMLAKAGEPFDSPDYLFEVKWDGTRALAYVDRDGLRLLNRRGVDLVDRYPDLIFLRDLPAGTVLDGEIVVLDGGKPDFGLLQARAHTRAGRVEALARTTPATYIVFDQLYHGYKSLMARPLWRRRTRLCKTVAACGPARLVLSEAVEGHGKAFFGEVCRQGLEGVMAKRLDGRYLPGKRTEGWIKIKRRLSIHCAVIGFVPSGKDDFRSLIIAAEEQGRLHCVGKVGTGFDEAMRRRLNALLWRRLRSKPIVPCPLRGKWVEPGIYCIVGYLERTKHGELRAPVFEELVLDDDGSGQRG